jgi:hypothetical protein
MRAKADLLAGGDILLPFHETGQIDHERLDPGRSLGQ